MTSINWCHTLHVDTSVVCRKTDTWPFLLAQVVSHERTNTYVHIYWRRVYVFVTYLVMWVVINTYTSWLRILYLLSNTSLLFPVCIIGDMEYCQFIPTVRTDFEVVIGVAQPRVRLCAVLYRGMRLYTGVRWCIRMCAGVYGYVEVYTCVWGCIQVGGVHTGVWRCIQVCRMYPGVWGCIRVCGGVYRCVGCIRVWGSIRVWRCIRVCVWVKSIKTNQIQSNPIKSNQNQSNPIKINQI